jgi:hypothetical protein
VARHLDNGWTLEVTRCTTNGTKNAASLLYGAAWRATKALGYRRLITYTLVEEPGTSLKAAGWQALYQTGRQLGLPQPAARGYPPDRAKNAVAGRVGGAGRAAREDEDVSDNDRLRHALEAPFPDHAIKQRQGGGNSRFSYIEGFTIIRRLNEATGGTWDWAIKSFEFRPLSPTKMGKDQSLVVVTGELTIPGLGTRAGVGVQKVSEDGGEDLVKGASTDALKKAATLFGVALDLYGPDYEGGEVAPPPAPSVPADSLAMARQHALKQFGPVPATLPEVEAQLTPLAKQVRTNDESLSPGEYQRYHDLEAKRKELLTAAPPDDLAIMRSTAARPEARKAALHRYYALAESPADLNVRADVAYETGIDADVLKAAFRHHHDRLSKKLAPAGING